MGELWSVTSSAQPVPMAQLHFQNSRADREKKFDCIGHRVRIGLFGHYINYQGPNKI